MWTRGGTDGVKEKTPSHIHPYGLSVEKPIRTRKIYLIILILDLLIRPWTDEVP